MTNVEALKALYAALGGDAADVADATTITAVLNAIAAKYEGADDATTNAEAIANIADVAGSIIPEPTSPIEKLTATNVSVSSELFAFNSNSAMYVFGSFNIQNKLLPINCTYSENFTPVSSAFKRYSGSCSDQYDGTKYGLSATLTPDNRTISIDLNSNMSTGQTYTFVLEFKS
jgi:hypothetical protein